MLIFFPTLFSPYTCFTFHSSCSPTKIKPESNAKLHAFIAIAGKESKIFSKYFLRDDRNIADHASTVTLKTITTMCFAFTKPSRFHLLNNTLHVAYSHFKSVYF